MTRSSYSIFDLDRRDVLAAGDDGVLSTVLDLQVAVGVKHLQVARSILFVEQYLDFTRSICDRFYVIEKGVVAPESDPGTFRIDEVDAYLSV